MTDTPFLPYEPKGGITVVAAGEHNGLNYAVIKIETAVGTSYYSHWACGYVLLPAGHPWRDLDLQYGEGDVFVHGGITYGPEADGWIGFDFNHGSDSWPGSYMSSISTYGVPRTVADVEAECLRLCEQAAAVPVNA